MKRPPHRGDGLFEAAKTALCVLCAVPLDNLHVNARKDIDIACEGIRQALAAHQPTLAVKESDGGRVD